MSLASRIAQNIAQRTGDIFKKSLVRETAETASKSLPPQFQYNPDMPDVPYDEAFDEIDDYIDLLSAAYMDEKIDMPMSEIREKFSQFLDDKNNLKGGEDFSLARGYTEEQIAINEAANKKQQEIDPDKSILNEVIKVLNPLREQAVKFQANVPENAVLPRKAKPLVDYFAREIDLYEELPQTENLSKKGLAHVARNFVIDAMNDEDTKDIVDLIIRELPKERADLDPTDVLLPDMREQALENYLKGSAETQPIYRAVSSYNNLNYDIGFAMPREVGVHVGTSGQANTVAARALLPEYSSEFTLPQRGGEQVDPSEFGEFFEEEAQKFLRPKTESKPITMLKGYIRVKNPLTLTTDMKNWDATVILTEGGINDIENAMIRQGVKITGDLKDELEELTVFANYINERPDPYKKGLYLDTFKRQLMRFETNKRFQTWLMKAGFDSIKYRNEIEPSLVGQDDWSYILFKPQQFKSVNAKLYDPKEPRDMRNKGGLVHPENKKFFENFHNRVVSEGRELVEDGQTTTMRIMGVGIGGKEYLIPSYDPDTKRVLSMDEAIEKYMPLIQDGKLKGYDTPQQAEADRRMFYPEIVGRDKKADGGYVIKSGDTLSQIAKDNNTTVAELARLNNIEDVNKIYAGQKLTLSDQVEEAMKPESKRAPKVKKAPEPEEDEGFNLNVDFAKQFVRGFFKTGDQETEDFSDKLRGVLRDAARNAVQKNQEYITYKEYPQLASGESAQDWVTGRRQGGFMDKLKGLFTDPVLNAVVTVGQGNLVREGGRVYFTDEYDFTRIPEDYSELGAYGKVRKWAGENFPEEGNKVRIDIGSEEEIYGMPKVAMNQQDTDTLGV